MVTEANAKSSATHNEGIRIREKARKDCNLRGSVAGMGGEDNEGIYDITRASRSHSSPAIRIDK